MQVWGKKGEKDKGVKLGVVLAFSSGRLVARFSAQLDKRLMTSQTRFGTASQISLYLSQSDIIQKPDSLNLLLHVLTIRRGIYTFFF